MDVRALAPSSRPSALRPPAGSGLAPAAGEGFGAALGQALHEVNELQLRARDAAVELATGRSADVAQTVVSIEKANVSFQLAMQIRNRLLEAYQEIMRMPV
jgi:flagellar hook-basal body complex protein FliE